MIVSGTQQTYLQLRFIPKHYLREPVLQNSIHTLRILRHRPMSSIYFAICEMLDEWLLFLSHPPRHRSVLRRGDEECRDGDVGIRKPVYFMLIPVIWKRRAKLCTLDHLASSPHGFCSSLGDRGSHGVRILLCSSPYPTQHQLSASTVLVNQA